MFRISTLNKISSNGLDLLPRDNYEVASEISNPDAVILRSFKMHDMEIPETVRGIARAGAGVNNIPVDKCTEQGIVVFNTPGANANAVKELVLAGLFLSSRKVFDSMKWAETLSDKGDEVPKLVEGGKSNYAGPEIKGKKLGVIGLGAIGVAVANDAISLGMDVVGYDPFISVDAAWGLSRAVGRATSIDALIGEVDYLTIHVPLNDKTKGLLNKDKFGLMKPGVRILNFSRNGLVNNADMKTALEEGKVSTYVTDFPDEQLLATEGVLCIPHLGASTPEAEENCAIMAVNQLKDFLETGNIKNSVNFPECSMAMNGGDRIILANKNIPNMVGQITTALADAGINISDMLNKHRGDYAYNIIDCESSVPENFIDTLKAIEGVVMARIIKG